MEMRGMIACGLGFGVLTLGLGGWAFSERSGRQAAEAKGAMLTTDLNTRTKDLADTTVTKDGALAQLEKTRQELAALQAKYLADGQAHVTATDKMLAKQNELLKAIDDSRKQIERGLAELQALDAFKTTLETQLEAQQSRNQKLQAMTAAERDAAKLAIDNQRKQLEASQKILRAQDEQLQATQKNLTLAEKEAQVNAALALAAEQQSQVLDSSLKRTSQDRDAYANGLQQTQAQAGQLANQLRTQDWQLQRQAREITKLQLEIERLRKLLPPGTK